MSYPTPTEMTMGEFTPELALVDPELAAQLRSTLPEPPDCLAPRARSVRPEPAATASPVGELVQPSRAHRRRAGRIAGVVAWAAIALALLSPMLAFLPTPEPSFGAETEPEAVTVSGTTVTDRKPSTATTQKKSTRTARAEKTSRTPGKVTLRWKRVAGAGFYDLILVHGGKRLDAWPKTNHYTLVLEPSPKKSKAAGRDVLKWYVFPGTRVNGVARFGKLHAAGKVQLHGRKPVVKSQR